MVIYYKFIFIYCCFKLILCYFCFVKGVIRFGEGNLLVDEKYIYSVQVKVVKEWKGCKFIIGGMLVGIKLDDK